MKLRNLKKDVLFLAQDLASILSVKLYLTDINPEQLSEPAKKTLIFRKNALAQIAANSKKSDKPLKSQLTKAQRLGAGKDEAVAQYVKAKKEHTKTMAANYRKFSAQLLEDYANLADEFSKLN